MHSERYDKHKHIFWLIRTTTLLIHPAEIMCEEDHAHPLTLPPLRACPPKNAAHPHPHTQSP